MTSPGKRRKKKKFYRTPGGKTREKRFKTKKPKAKDMINGETLEGVKAQKGGAKSKKRPSAPFAGILSSKNRTLVIEEAVKVKQGIKKIEEVDLSIRRLVESALAKIE